MAAPMLSQDQKSASLKKVKTSSKKAKLKNVLCGDSLGWPKPSKEVEEAIVLKLAQILRSLPNIFKPVKNASKQEQEGKRRVRSQLDIGTNSVCRSLEKDRLACVLLSSEVKPKSAADHIVSIARERGCPLLCLETLSSTLAKATKSKCLPLCIGFKKLMVSSSSDFVDIITLIKDNTNVIKRPLALKTLNKLKKEVTTTFLPESLRPVSLDINTDEAVCQELKRIFSSAIIRDEETKILTHKDRKRNKNKKKKVKQYYRKWLHNQFESGKKTVTDFVGIGKIRLVLVIKELLPVLMTEQPMSSLLCVARDMDCPVIAISSLKMIKCSDSAKTMAVLGIKKETVLPNNVKSAFNPVIDLCTDFLRTVSLPAQDMDVEDSGEGHDVKSNVLQGKPTVNEDENPLEKDYSYLYVSKKDSVQLQERAEKLKEEQENTTKQMTFSSDFISFSGRDNKTPAVSDAESMLGKRKSAKPLKFAKGKPKRMLMDTSEQKQANVSGAPSGFISFGSSENLPGNIGTDDKTRMEINTSILSGSLDSNSFSIHRAGDSSNKLSVEQNISSSSLTESAHLPQSSVNALGLEELSQSKDEAMDEESKHIVNVFSANSKKGKGEDKKRHRQEGFVSFAYTEANIKTMVANPSKKKKKKKKKGGQ